MAYFERCVECGKLIGNDNLPGESWPEGPVCGTCAKEYKEEAFPQPDSTDWVAQLHNNRC